jgi:hypothetical protein
VATPILIDTPILIASLLWGPYRPPAGPARLRRAVDNFFAAKYTL